MSQNDSDASEILWNLCHPGSTSMITRNKFRHTSILAKLIIENPVIGRGDYLKGKVLMMSRVPKDQLRIGITFTAQLRMERADQKEPENPISSLFQKKASIDRQNSPVFGVIIEEEREEDHEIHDMNGEIHHNEIDQEDQEEKKEFDAIISQNNQSQQQQKHEVFRIKGIQKCRSTKFVGSFKSNKDLRNNNLKMEPSSLDNDQMNELICHSPLSPFSKSLKNPQRKNPKINFLLHDPNVRILFKRNQTLFTFSRKTHTNTPFQIPFSFKIPEDLPFSDQIRFNRNDNMEAVIQGSVKKIKGVFVEYFLRVFLEDERDSETIFKDESVSVTIKRFLAQLPLPEKESEWLSFEKNDIEAPSFFECIFSGLCQSSSCIFQVQMNSQSSILVTLECPKFKSKRISGFLVVLTCQTTLEKNTKEEVLWEKAVLVDNNQPINFKEAIEDKLIHFYPNIDLPRFSIKQSIKVFAQIIDQKGRNESKLLSELPISTDRLLAFRESVKLSKHLSSATPNLKSGNEFLSSVPEESGKSSMIRDSQVISLPFAVCSELSSSSIKET